MNCVSLEHVIWNDPKFLENLNISMKETVQNNFLEPMSKFGYTSIRSTMWVIEECLLQYDSTMKVENFHQLSFEMLKKFDGFHGVEIKPEWMPGIGTFPHWSTLSFNLVDQRKYESLLKEKSDSSYRRVNMVIKLASIVLAVLEKNAQFTVVPEIQCSVFVECLNAFTAGLLESFMSVFPKVSEQVKLPPNKSLVRVRKFQDNVLLPGVGSLLKKRKCFDSNSGVSASSKGFKHDEHLTNVVYYLPENMHPSWTTSLKPPVISKTVSVDLQGSITVPEPFVAPDPNFGSDILPIVTLDMTPYALTSELPSPYPNLNFWSLQPSPIIALSPTVELAHLPIIIVQIKSSEKKKRRYISKEDRDRLKSFVEMEDLKLSTSEAVKRVMQRQQQATGFYDHFNQVRSLVKKMKKERSDS